MADEKPVEEKPVEQPVVAEAAPAEAVVAAEAAPAEVAKEAPVEAPKEEAAVEKTPSLLESATAPGTEEKPAEEKPAEEKAAEAPKEGDQPKAPEGEEKPKEAAKEGDQPKAEEKPAEAAKPEPVEYKYELPETIKMDDARRTEVHGAFDAFRANPADPTPLFKQAERMMQDYDKVVRQQQVDAWNSTKENWRKEVLADEMIGGSGHQTAMGQVAMVRNRFVSDHAEGSAGWKKDVSEFVHFLDSTGAGDHPVFLRFLHRQARFLNEPAAPVVNDLKPAPDAGRRKGGDVLYDNDRSPNGRQ